jgi:hypothetical protein
VECDDADSCTVDRCEPTSALADLGGCVHDHGDLPGIRCVLEVALARTRCAGDRIERHVDAGLTRTMQLVVRASATPAGPARNVLVRRAKRAVSRLARRLNGFVKRRAGGVCLDPVRQQVAGIRSTLRTLSSTRALSAEASTRLRRGPSW